MGDSLRIEVDLNNIKIEPLDQSMSRAAFSCTEARITNFFRNNAKKQHLARTARVYVAVHEAVPVGFYSLAAKSHAPLSISQESEEKFARITSAPSIYIGMLGVNTSHCRNGIGRLLILDAMRKALKIADLLGVYALTLDALDETVAARYERWGFRRFLSGERAMFMTVGTIRKAFPD